MATSKNPAKPVATESAPYSVNRAKAAHGFARGGGFYAIRVGLGYAALYGLGAGAAGVAAMTASAKVEQTLITGRPNSYVPAHTLARIVGVLPTESNRLYLNHAMHWGQGITAGVIRGIMAYNGVCGPFADFMFTGLRLLIDQTLENLTGVGALPWTWPWQEQIVDLVHKAVYAVVTGIVTDRLVLGYRG